MPACCAAWERAGGRSLAEFQLVGSAGGRSFTDGQPVVPGAGSDDHAAQAGCLATLASFGLLYRSCGGWCESKRGRFAQGGARDTPATSLEWLEDTEIFPWSTSRRTAPLVRARRCSPSIRGREKGVKGIMTAGKKDHQEEIRS